MIINKLSFFAPPDEPLVGACLEKIAKAGGTSFPNASKPEAVKMKDLTLFFIFPIGEAFLRNLACSSAVSLHFTGYLGWS